MDRFTAPKDFSDDTLDAALDEAFTDSDTEVHIIEALVTERARRRFVAQAQELVRKTNRLTTDDPKGRAAELRAALILALEEI